MYAKNGVGSKIFPRKEESWSSNVLQSSTQYNDGCSVYSYDVPETRCMVGTRSLRCGTTVLLLV